MTAAPNGREADWDAILAMPLREPRFEIRHGDVWKAPPAHAGEHVCDGTGMLAIAFFAESDGGIVSYGSAAAVATKVAKMAAGLDPEEHHFCVVSMPVHPMTVRALNLAVCYGWTQATMIACLDHLRSNPTITLPARVPD